MYYLFPLNCINFFYFQIHPHLQMLPPPDLATWHATEVPPFGSKDTFWRDFDEGKISVSGTVYDKDMYSKVKERAERAGGSRPVEKITEPPTHRDGGMHKEGPSVIQPPLCPKVLLKRKTVGSSGDVSG